MTFEIGHLTLQPVVPAARPDAVDVMPGSPPPDVLTEVDAAWERAAELAARNRELHFRRDEGTGRRIIEVRTLDGEVLRTIPPSRMLDVMAGEAP